MTRESNVKLKVTKVSKPIEFKFHLSFNLRAQCNQTKPLQKTDTWPARICEKESVKKRMTEARIWEPKTNDGNKNLRKNEKESGNQKRMTEARICEKTIGKG